MPTLPRDWSIAEVGEFLGQIGLGHLSQAFRDNAVTGRDLLELTDDDLKTSLGCTPLQARKIRNELGMGGGETSAPAPASFLAPAAAPKPAMAPAPPPQQAQQAQAAAESRQHAETYARAAAALRSAEGKLSGALGSLKTTQALGAVDAIHDRRIGRMGRAGGASAGGIRMAQRGGIGGDVIEAATVHRADAAVKSAAQDIEAARSLLPNLPFINPASLGSAKAGVFQNMVFGGRMSDVMQMAQVQRSSAAIKEMQSEVHQALQWVEQNQQGAQAAAMGAAQAY